MDGPAEVGACGASTKESLTNDGVRHGLLPSKSSMKGGWTGQSPWPVPRPWGSELGTVAQDGWVQRRHESSDGSFVAQRWPDGLEGRRHFYEGSTGFGRAELCRRGRLASCWQGRLHGGSVRQRGQQALCRVTLLFLPRGVFDVRQFAWPWEMCKKEESFELSCEQEEKGEQIIEGQVVDRKKECDK